MGNGEPRAVRPLVRAATAVVGAAALIVSLVAATPATAAPTPISEAVPDTVPLTGVLMVVPVEPEGPQRSRADHRSATPSDASGVTVRLVTDDGATVELTGAAVEDAVSGTRFEGTVAVPAEVADKVEQDAAPPGAPPVADLVVDALEQAAAPLDVIDADLTPPTAAAVAAKQHTVDVLFAAPAGYTAPSQATINALTTRLNEYWPSQTNGQISGVVRSTTYRTATIAAANLCSPYGMWDYAAGPAGFNRAPQQGIDYSSYYWIGTRSAHLIVLVPDSVCGYSGLGTVSAIHTGGTVFAAVPVGKPLEWDQVVFHEFGHNVGLGHSNVRACTPPAVDGPTCSDAEYGDYYDVMAGGFLADTHNNFSDMPALNLTHRAHLDALPREGSLKTVTSGGGAAQTFTLAPISATTGLRGLEIRDPINQDRYYVEYRSGTGRDASSFYADLTNDPNSRYRDWLRPGIRVLKLVGCVVPASCPGADSTVLQRRDGDTATQLYHLTGDEFLSATTAGAYSGVRVRVASMTAASATVEVTFDSVATKFAATRTVTVTGTRSYYGLLTATLGGAAWSPVPDSVSYEWLRNGKVIRDATASTYRIGDADLGANIAVRVIARKAGYARAVVTSAAVPIASTWQSNGSISGTVSLPAGVSPTAREGMQVHAFATDAGFAGYGSGVIADVDAATGRYSLTGLTPGEWRVQIVPGYTDDPVSGNAVAIDLASQWYSGASTLGASTPIHVFGAVTGIDVTLTRGRTISGTVSLPAGAPQAWRGAVQVRAQSSMRDDYRAAYPRGTYASVNPTTGAYTLRGLDPGTYEVFFEVAPPFGSDPVPLASEWYNGVYSPLDATPVDVTAGDRTGVNASLERTRTISGTITLPAGSPPIWMRQLWVTIESDVSFPTGAEVQPDGTFRVTDLTPGLYTVCVSTNGSAWDPETGNPVAPNNLLPECWNDVFASSEATPVDVRSADRAGLSIALIAERTIAGTVSLPAGIPQSRREHVTVLAEPIDAAGFGRYDLPTVSAKPDIATGRYTLHGLVPGRYTVRFDVPQEYFDDAAGTYVPTQLAGFWHPKAQSQSTATVLDLATGSRTGIDATLLRATGTVSGTIDLSAFPSGSITSALVILVDRSGTTSLDYSGITGTGSFQFTRVPDGDYRILLDVSQQVSATYRHSLQYLAASGGSKLFTVAPGGSLTGLNLKAAAATASVVGSITAAGFDEDATFSELGRAMLYERMGTEWVGYPESIMSVSGNDTMWFTQHVTAGTYTVGYLAAEGAYEATAAAVVQEWWDSRASLAAADSIVLAAGQKRDGVHGAVHPVGVVPPDPVQPGGPIDNEPDPPTPTDPDAGTVKRLAGADRYQTSAAISKASFSPGVPIAYIANGQNFPDALSGAPLAGISRGPVLLSQKNALPAAIKAELTRLKPGKIMILGGTGAISATVATALRSYTTGTVGRLAGADRYATSVDISAKSFARVVPVVYLANGTNFPDALSGAPVAGVEKGPVLLTPKGSLPSVVQQELARLSPGKIVILGGTSVVSEQVRAQAQRYTMRPVTRLSGADRYATSAAISKASFDPGVPVVYIANGANFPDALSGAPVAGATGGPVLLTTATSIPAVIKTELTRLKPGKIVVLGGTGVVSAAVATQLASYLK